MTHSRWTGVVSRLGATLLACVAAASAARAQCSSNVVFFEDFDGPLVGWTLSGSWRIGPSSFCLTTCTQGLSAGLELNNGPGCRCDNAAPSGPDCRGDLVSPWIDLPAVAPGDSLELLFCADLYKHFNCPSSFGNNCHLLSVSTAGGAGEVFVLMKVGDIFPPTCPDPIVAPPFDLSAYAGESVQLTWTAGCIDQDGGRSIFNVDDVLILHTPSPLATHCTSLPNSTGVGATLWASGSTSASANDLVLEGAQCPPGEIGVFVLASGPGSTPFGNGVLCVSGGVSRFPGGHVVQPGGTVSYAVDNQAPPAQGKLLPGSTWFFQFWFRDTTAGGSGFNLTDGMAGTFCP